MYRPGHASADSESLQTDVMRFMAIIAFCLIAILALVRNAEPPTPPVTKAEPPQALAAPGTNDAPVDPAIKPPPPSPRDPATEDAAESLQAMQPIQPIAGESPQQLTRRTASPAAGPAPGARRPAPPAHTPASSAAPSGLSLRFASDGDFVRLVAKGDIQVYAYQAEDVLSLDRDFQFLECPPPDEVYQLLPETIPALVTTALSTQRSNAAAYAWGIRMPRGLEKQIRAFVDKGATGLLVINRHAEIHHVAES